MKVSPNAPPILVTQISAYQQNYFRVAELIEDSQTKAAALATVQEMEDIMQSVRTYIHILPYRSLSKFLILATRSTSSC